MRWGLGTGFVIVVDLLAFAACETVGSGDAAPRYYVAPDANEEGTTADGATPYPETDALAVADGGGDATPDADTTTAEAGDAAALPPPSLLATGSGFHPDPLIGNGDHTCVVTTAGAATIWCWGANDHGQLGLGTSGDGTTAADVATATRIAIDETGLPFEEISEVALAGWHSCARRKDVLFCWGQRFSGAQAEPPSAIGPDRTRPRAVGNLDVARIAADGPHTCVVKSDGKQACFGHSTFSELGRASTDDPACTAPIFYPYQANATHKCSGTLLGTTNPLPLVSIVSAGEVHSCALASGNAHCWGTNLGGQLGRPGTQLAELAPQLVVTDPVALGPLDKLTALVSGGKHSCALREGAVFCWGTNDAGQLGADPATVPQRAFAAAVPGLVNAVSIGVAERVSCAVTADKTVSCWGADIPGLPDGGAIISKPAPTQVKGPGGTGLLTDVVAVAPGFRHVCARKTDSSVWCWGKNDRGQLGDGTKVDSQFPVKVTGLP